jgi:hypothetical protein
LHKAGKGRVEIGVGAELLHKLVPNTAAIGVLVDPTNAPSSSRLLFLACRFSRIM